MNDVAVMTDSVPGLESFGREEMQLPRLRLVQSQSVFSEDAGQIHNSLTGEAKPQLTIVVIGARKGRIMWPAQFQRNQEPLCASDDGETAREGKSGQEYDGTPTTDCNLCCHSQWGDDHEPPKCSLSYNFLVVETGNELPALINFSRSSATAGKQLVTMIKAFGFKRSVVIGVEQKKNDQGKFYVFTVKLGEILPPETQAQYAGLARQFGTSKITTDSGEDLRNKPTETDGIPDPRDDDYVPGDAGDDLPF